MPKRKRSKNLLIKSALTEGRR